MPLIRLSRTAAVTRTETGALLRSDLGTFQLDGPDIARFLETLASHLRDWRDPEDVVHALHEFSPDSVRRLLALLAEKGLLETRPEAGAADERWRGQVAFFRAWTTDPEAAMRRLREGRILLLGLEPWGVAAALELAASGLGALHLLDDGVVGPADPLSVRAFAPPHVGLPRSEVLRQTLTILAPWCRVTSGALTLDPAGAFAPPPGPWDLWLVALPGDALRARRAAARAAHAAGVRSLSAHLDGLDAMLGPGVVPGETACWECCRLRMLAHADPPEPAHRLHDALLDAAPAPRERTYLAPMAATLGHLLALEAVKIVAAYTPSTLMGRLRTLNLVTLESELHTVIRMPWCETCGGAASRAAHPSPPAEDLADAPDPAALRTKLNGWVDNRTGVLRSLDMAVPSARDPDLPWAATAVPARYTEGRPDPHPPAVGSGKGLTRVDALLGAAGEALERYSAARFRVADLRRARQDELEGDVLDPRDLALYAGRQYDEPGFPFARPDPDRPLHWTRARWLDTGGPVWVPALPVFFQFPAPREEYFCQVSSNGLAAGKDTEDAARRAICELLERDAFLLSWLSRRPGARLRPDSTLDPKIAEVLRPLTHRGACVELYSLDVGLGLPVVTALAFGDGREWPGAVAALAAHPDPRVAVRKAVLELGHVAPYIRRLMTDGAHPIPAAPEDVRTLEDHALYYAPPERARAFDWLRDGSPSVPLAAWDSQSMSDSLSDIAARLSAGGVRVAVVDVTSPDLLSGPFRVARALGPNVQPIDFGHHLRRLGNPRLHALLAGAAPNPDPHPLA